MKIFTNAEVIPSQYSYDETVLHCNKKNQRNQKINAVIILFSIILFAATVFLIFHDNVQNPDGAFMDAAGKLFPTFILFFLMLVVDVIAMRSTDYSPADHVVLSYKLQQENFKLVELNISEGDDELSIAVADKDNTVKIYELDLSDYEVIRKINLEKPVLNFKEKTIMLPYTAGLKE